MGNRQALNFFFFFFLSFELLNFEMHIGHQISGHSFREKPRFIDRKFLLTFKKTYTKVL